MGQLSLEGHIFFGGETPCWGIGLFGEPFWATPAKKGEPLWTGPVQKRGPCFFWFFLPARLSRQSSLEPGPRQGIRIDGFTGKPTLAPAELRSQEVDLQNGWRSFAFKAKPGFHRMKQLGQWLEGSRSRSWRYPIFAFWIRSEWLGAC